MIRRLYHTLAVLAIAHVLAGVAGVAYLFQTGRLTPERAQEIVALLRGSAEAGDEQAAPQLDEQPEAEPWTNAADAVREQRRQQQTRRAALDASVRALNAQRDLLEQVLADQIRKQEQFDAARKAWVEEKSRQQVEASDAGFQRELEYFSKLSPKQAKEVLIRKWRDSPPDAVRLINAVKTSVGQAVFEQMKTPEEIQVMYELLERLGKQDIDQFVAESGTTADDTEP
ncbi:MAG: hypothetical protein D6744_18360 [Planctomycetota bacterium]|nr:MAG: hypothetical protein D6744_18360 [Planctomycetota bacterium]